MSPSPPASGAAGYRTGEYHRRLFSDDPFVRETLGLARARKLSRWIRPEDRVFELGVGPGLNLSKLVARERVGFDLNDDCAAACRALGIEFVSDLAALAGRQFDVVLVHHVLEHVPDPLGTLRGLQDLLPPEGRLQVHVPFDAGRFHRRDHPDDPNHHLFSWTALTLANLVREAGYDVKHVTVQPYGYEQRLAPLRRFGWTAYRAVLGAARLVRPSDEVELVALRGGG